MDLEKLINYKTVLEIYPEYNDLILSLYELSYTNILTYINNINSIKKITKNKENYPILILPKSLIKIANKQQGKKTKWKEKDNPDYFSINDIESIANELKLYIKKVEAIREPIRHIIQKEYIKSYKKISSGSKYSIIVWCIVILLGVVFGNMVFENILGIIITTTLWILLSNWVMEGLLFDKDMYIEEDTKKVEYSDEERTRLQEIEDLKYEDEMKKYREENKIYKSLARQRHINLNKNFITIMNTYFKKAILSQDKYNRSFDDVQQGAIENVLFLELMKIYPQYVKIDSSVFGYYPDILLDINGESYIDIEIDEPYDYKTKKEIHYIGCEDEIRNNFFSEKNWFVLRFSEDQVKKNLKECAMIIKNIVDYTLTPQYNHLDNYLELSNKIKTPRWTKEQSRLMALLNIRKKT